MKKIKHILTLAALLATVAAVPAEALFQPSGAVVGDKYQILFTTSVTYLGSSIPDVTDANSKVNTQAASSALTSGVNYKAIASDNGGVDAINNVAASSSLDPNFIGIYTVDDVLVAGGTNLLFDGSTTLSSIAGINENGSQVSAISKGTAPVWTGSNNLGLGETSAGSRRLGDSSIAFGNALSLSTPTWIGTTTTNAVSSELGYLYGLSEVITVGGAAVPEPSAYLLLHSAGAFLLARHRHKHLPGC